MGAFFVSVDAFIAVKTGYITIYAYYMITCLSITYGGGRPFWESNEIATPVCLKTYSHPSRSTFLILFVMFYLPFCMRHRLVNSQDGESNDETFKYRVITIVSIVLCTGYALIKYLLGLDFIVNIVLAVIYFIIYYSILTFIDEYID
jgi:hypothetical protein